MPDYREVEVIINTVEQSLIRDYFISSSFNDIRNRRINKKSRRVIILIAICHVINGIRFLIGAVVDQESPWNDYVVNSLAGFGFIGRFMCGIYAFGHVIIICFPLVTLLNEQKGDLAPVTDLMKMYQRLRNSSEEDVNSFLYYLKVIPLVNKVGWIVGTIPMVLFSGVGSLVTAYQKKSITFAICYLPFFLAFFYLHQYSITTFSYTTLFMAQSSNYLKLRLKRVKGETVKNVLYMKNSASFLRNISIEMNNLQDILNEVHDHNRIIKHWLHQTFVCIGGVFIFYIVFILGTIEWYYRILTLGFFGAVALVTGVAFFNLSNLHTRITRIVQLLHSCQTVVNVNNNNLSINKYKKIVKIKFQVIRLIHRVSSPFLKVGFTTGSGESFSSAASAKFLITVIITSLMFVNTKV